MDTSEQYIKMCDCEEIQELRRPTTDGFRIENVWEDGDIIKYPQGRVRLFNPLWFEGGIEPKQYVWLPRQDQLQEMLKLPLLDLLCRFRDFIEFGKNPSYAALFTSMEQLWLAFVMKTLHSKIWSNEAWVSE